MDTLWARKVFLRCGRDYCSQLGALHEDMLDRTIMSKHCFLLSTGYSKGMYVQQLRIPAHRLLGLIACGRPFLSPCAMYNGTLVS